MFRPNMLGPNPIYSFSARGFTFEILWIIDFEFGISLLIGRRLNLTAIVAEKCAKIRPGSTHYNDRRSDILVNGYITTTTF